MSDWTLCVVFLFLLFLNVLPPVLTPVGWAVFLKCRICFILASMFCLLSLVLLKRAVQKIHSLLIPIFLYSIPNSFTEKTRNSPERLIAVTSIKISLNSDPKQPEFILNPPPTVPGIQDKNSKLVKLFAH